MKVILNDDVKYLGEMGDVKNVARGYFRNYLSPRGLAVIYCDESVAYFEGKKAEIEARKAQKRAESASLKDKLEALEVVITMPAGSNGKLFGAVTSQTIANFYSTNGFEIERKKIEIQGLTIKNVGSYTIKIHLYESTVAEVKLVVKAQEDKDAKDNKDSSKNKKEVKSQVKAEKSDVATETKEESVSPASQESSDAEKVSE